MVFILVIFLLFNLLIFKELTNFSVKNSKFIEIVPLEIVVTNQYFKIYLNTNKY